MIFQAVRARRIRLLKERRLPKNEMENIVPSRINQRRDMAYQSATKGESERNIMVNNNRILASGNPDLIPN
jgi:hypothetical protein